jgi:hypothetical protein
LSVVSLSSTFATSGQHSVDYCKYRKCFGSTAISYPLVWMSTGNSKNFAETARASHLAFLEIITESSIVFDGIIRGKPGSSQSVAGSSSGSSQCVARNSSGTSQQSVAGNSSGTSQSVARSSSGTSQSVAGNSCSAAVKSLDSLDTSWSATASSSGSPLGFVGAKSKAAPTPPPAPRDRSRSKQPWEDLQSDKYSPEQMIELQAEAEVAHRLGIRWQDRGPPGGKRGDTWRGQEFRETTQRYANRGGKCREWYTGMYRAKAAGTLEKFLEEHPKPK